MQQNPIVSYITKLTFYSIGICFLFLFSMLLLPKEYFVSNTPYYIAMFYVCTLAGYVFTYFSIKNKKMKFENIFMITKFSKLFIYAIVLTVVLLAKIETTMKFAITYLIIYFLYLIFDTITLNKLSKQNRN